MRLTPLLNALRPLITTPGLPFVARAKSPLRLTNEPKSSCSYYCGGFIPLTQAARTLSETTDKKVAYCHFSQLAAPSQISYDPTTFVPHTFSHLSEEEKATLGHLDKYLRASSHFHHQLNSATQKALGTPLFNFSGRVVYTTSDRHFSDQLEKASAFGTPYEPFDEEGLAQCTLLKADCGITPFFKKDGGHLVQGATIRLLTFLKTQFPDRFFYSSLPLKTPSRSSLFVAGGNLLPLSETSQALWEDRSICEVQTLWEGTIPHALFSERISSFAHLLPLENQWGLFFTPLSATSDAHNVTVTAQLNYSFALDESQTTPPALLMGRELEARFIGSWKWLSSKAVWHDTTPPSRMPEDLASRWLNLGPLGNSLSGARLQESDA